MQRTLLTLAMALAAGFAGAAAFTFSGLGDRQVENYLVANPEVLQRMVQGLEAKRAEEKLARAGNDLRQPFAGAVLGNPEGSHTLIKFTDYNCGYCRASAAEVQKLIAQDPELKVIIREWPIFDGSSAVAGLALAATKQGKYEAFHQALFAGGDTSTAGIAAAAQKVGIDFERLKKDAADPQIVYELERNTRFAQELGFTGTPSWIAGNRVIEGAVPADTLAQAIAEGA